MQIENNGKAIERGILILGFLAQLAVAVYGYGKVSQQVSDLGSRLERVERYIDSRIEHSLKP
jgi:hypothetical protein